MYRRQRSGFDRVPYAGICDVEHDGAHDRGLLCNISILGAYVHSEKPPVRDTEVQLAFELPDGGAPVHAAATVAWVNNGPLADSTSLPHGFGAHFLEVNHDDIRRIATLVSSFLDTPEPEFQFGVGIPRSGRARIPFVTPCTVVLGTRVYSGTVCNLSTLGMFVALDEPLGAGASGRVHFGVAGVADDMQVDAVVTWVNARDARKLAALPPGCGLRFERLTSIDEVVLNTVVERYLDSIAAQRAPIGTA